MTMVASFAAVVSPEGLAVVLAGALLTLTAILGALEIQQEKPEPRNSLASVDVRQPGPGHASGKPAH